MPAGYSSKCKSCNSPHRLQIEYWHEKDGKSPEIIEALLRKEYGEEISCRAIRNHLTDHYNVREEATEKYKESQQQIEKDADERLTDLQILDELIADSHIIHSGLSQQIKETSNKLGLNMPNASMLNGTAAEICRAIKTKAEILGEDPTTKAIETFLDLIKSASEQETSKDNS